MTSFLQRARGAAGSFSYCAYEKEISLQTPRLCKKTIGKGDKKMKSKKAVRSALGMSVLSIALCAAMLIGTTFAWFTDTASTAVNKIQAGTLKVDIVDKEGTSLDKGTLTFKDKYGNTDILWEPGATFNLDSFKIVNKGNLALKYKVVVSGVNGSSKLLEAIEFKVKVGEKAPVALADLDGILLPEGKSAVTDSEKVKESDLITISGHMKETAGNEYQGLSIEGVAITVYATQYTYESDSKDNKYDDGAEYNPTLVDNDKIEGELSANEENIYVALSSNVSFDVKPYDQKPMGGDKTKNIVIDGKGYKLTFNNTNSDWNNVTWGGAKLTIKNAVIDNSGYNADGGAWNSHDINFKGNLVLENVTFTNAVALNGTAVLKNVTISDPTATQDTYMLWICAGSNVTAENLTINGKSSVGNQNRAIAIKDQYVTDPAATTLTINGATITSDKYAAVYVTSASATTVNLNGVIDVTGTAVNDKVVQIGSGVVTVNDNSTKVVGKQEDLNAAITSATGPVAVKLAEGTYTLPALDDKDITVVGTKDTVIDMKEQVRAHATNVAFEGVTVNFGTSNYMGFQHTAALSFKDCVINGFMTTYGDVTYENCTLNSVAGKYAINFYGGENFTLTNCHFYGVNKNVYIYQETCDSDKNVTFNQCDFHMTGTSDLKSAVMLNAANDFGGNKYNVTLKNCTVEGANTTAAEDVAGNTNYQGLYGLKHLNAYNNPQLVKGTVTVDGTVVYSK